MAWTRPHSDVGAITIRSKAEVESVELTERVLYSSAVLGVTDIAYALFQCLPR